MLLATDGTLKISDFGVAEVRICFIHVSRGMVDVQTINFYHLSDHNNDLEGHMKDEDLLFLALP